MDLTSTIEEQQVFGFSGKINILDAKTSRILGFVSLNEGVLHSCTFYSGRGSKAFFNAIVSDRSKNNFRIIVEPEVVDGLEKNLFYTMSDYKLQFEKEYQDYKASMGMKPPDNLKLSIKPDFIAHGKVPDSHEFAMLEVITDYQRIEEIYEKVDLFEHQATKALIGLRKKGALKVLAG